MGAGAGAAAGPWGALAGGALGLIGGIFSAYGEEEDEERKEELLEEAQQKFNLTQDQVDDLLEQYYQNPDNFLGTPEDVQAYQKFVREYKPNDYVYEFKPFQYVDENGKEKTVDDFVNPYYDKIISDTSKRIQNSAAGAGVGRGTGAANAIAQGVAEKENELYQTALNQYNTDRAQTYAEWSGNIDKMQQRLNALRAATETQGNNLGNLAQSYTDAQQNKFSDQIGAMQNRSNGNLQLASMGLMI
jgi:coenzyme F420-reducing hydrogenase alpha subunit